jgi:hypothetical protein
MSAEFVPFLPALRRRLAAVSSEGFSPLAAPPASSSAAPIAPPNPNCAAGPNEVTMELKRSGDRVTQIRIRCRCGEIIELDCEY